MLTFAALAGTGPMGRIIIADVVAAQDRETADAPPMPPASRLTPPCYRPDSERPGREFTVVPVRGARKITGAADARAVARRQRAADAHSVCQSEAALRYAKRLRRVTDATSRPRIGLNDLIMFATRACCQLSTRRPTPGSTGMGSSSSAHVNLGFADRHGAGTPGAGHSIR